MLYNKTAWKLEKKYGGAASSYDALRLAVTEKPEVFDEFDLPLSLKLKVIEQIKRRLTPQPVKIRADVEVTCYEYEGVEAVKAALRSGLALGTEDLPIKINLIAPPTYVVTTVSLDKDKGIALLNEAIAAITETITTKKGRISIKMAAKAVTESDEKELAAKMEEYERNFEGSGDEEEEEEDVGMGVAGGSKAAAE
jgi:translation initiation factor 2 subunit 1